MKTVYDFKVEFLRKGPAHNQLLSPLTDYTVLCADRPASVVNVPYEHWEFLHQLKALRYTQKEQRDVALLKTSQDMAAMLKAVPGFGQELTKAQCSQYRLANLRLVITASELALLPFEMAQTPKDCPGEGEYLLVQDAVPLSLTREVRRPSGVEIDWRRGTRILFIAASPPKAGPVPLKSHVQILRRVIQPWVLPYDDDDAAGRAKQVGALLTLLPEASIKEIQTVCEEAASQGKGYTHVHLLAHGATYDEIEGERYGMALHQHRDKTKMHVVNGSQLAAALRQGASDPLVVTVASCDSANLGTVLVPGASLAHALHVAGIPVVVASQFPLSFEGSRVMTYELYRRMLRGDDPRLALHKVRGLLYSRQSSKHDWASLVAYMELPSNFEEQLQQYHFERARDAARSVRDYARWLIKHREDQIQENDELLEKTLSKLDTAIENLPDLESDKTESTGWRGSLEKQKAELLLGAAEGRDVEQAQAYHKRSTVAFNKALEHYRKAFFSDLSSHWNGIQYLALLAVVDKQVPYDLWSVVRVGAEEESRQKKDDVWAFGTLAELYMLGVLLDKRRVTQKQAHEKAVASAKEILHRKGKDSSEAFSTWRQFQRYVDWWKDELPAIQPIAREVVALLKPTDPDRWV